MKRVRNIHEVINSGYKFPAKLNAVSVNRLFYPQLHTVKCLNSRRQLLSTKILTSMPFSTMANGNHRGYNGSSETSSLSTSGKTIDYDSFVNSMTLKRKPSLIREMTKMAANAEPGTIFMAGGLPNPDLFPFKALSVQLEDNVNINLNEIELKAALQYQPTLGYPALHSELRNFVVHHFNPPQWANSEVIVTVGSQNGLSSVLNMCLSHGDPVIVPQPVYTGALNIMDPYSPVYLEVPEDSLGMQPSHLKSVLANWYSNSIGSNSEQKKPKILYVNPTGANPSGINIPAERKREIYKIAQEYNLIILEDDPYYFLHFEKEDPKSFLSLDVDGRVIRFDSFSKVLSSGLRVGFATGPKQLIRHMELSLQSTVLHASSLSQVLVYGVLKQWGVSGFLEHTNQVKDLYKKRRDQMVTAAERHLKGLAEWHVPRGGMFLWMKVLGVKDTYSMVMQHGLSQKIMLLPGREFMPNRQAPCSYLRAAYSVVPLDKMDEGMHRLASLIKDEQKRQ